MSAVVLVVEDDPDIREALEAALDASGFDVIAARHGADAIERTLARGRRPSIILLDLTMPVMDGESFLEIRASQPLLAEVPVVIMSAQLRLPEPMPSGVRAVLTKPAPLATIIEMIRLVCIEVPVPAANPRAEPLGVGDLDFLVGAASRLVDDPEPES